MSREHGAVLAALAAAHPDRAIVVGSARHLARIREFARRVGDPDRRERHWLLQAAPASWRADESALPARLRALLAGLDGT